MGHLDPFLQDLNGIGIIAMMVGISAVIVRLTSSPRLKPGDSAQPIRG